MSPVCKQAGDFAFLMTLTEAKRYVKLKARTHQTPPGFCGSHILAIYVTRMKIKEAFRNLKNPLNLDKLMNKFQPSCFRGSG